MKHAFELLAPNDVPTVLIHYIGDEKCAVPYAHGNATSDKKVHKDVPISYSKSQI